MSAGNASRVAAIAIHGVGDHLPEEMAKAAGSMLESRQTTGGKRAWGPLDELRLSGTHAVAASATQRRWTRSSRGPDPSLRFAHDRQTDPTAVLVVRDD